MERWRVQYKTGRMKMTAAHQKEWDELQSLRWLQISGLEGIRIANLDFKLGSQRMPDLGGELQMQPLQALLSGRLRRPWPGRCIPGDLSGSNT